MLNDKRLLKVDAEKIRNLLTSQQSDLISDGAASLILKVSKFMNKWWAVLDSNQRPPQCQCDALPSAPTALKKVYSNIKSTKNEKNVMLPLVKQFTEFFHSAESSAPTALKNVYSNIKSTKNERM